LTGITHGAVSASPTSGGTRRKEGTMSKRMIGTIALLAALALPGTAVAERIEFDDRMDRSELPSATSCDLIMGTSVTNDELSANERIMADAWKSHFHARKAAALEGRE
jgi:hypothetical protein